MSASTHRARKRFGQHFLVDTAVIDEIIAAIGPASGETLVEIGPGQGALTGRLRDSGATLHAIEFDRDLAGHLRERFRHDPKMTVHEEDALAFEYSRLGSDLRIVGNLPYNISTPLLFHLIDALPAIRDMHFMLQKEVVDRMAAGPGSKRYGKLTVMLGCHCRVERLFDVPPDAFNPPPRVQSSVVRLVPIDEARPLIRDEEALRRLVTQAFSQRRKTLRNALKNWATDDQLRAAGIDPGLRAEAVPIARWVALSNSLTC